MYRDLPPLAWLRAFEVSARRLSFTAAAQELNLTQAAISKHVKSLELRLQRPLFVRHPRSLELTKWAEAYLPKVQDALERLASGTREVFGHPHGDILTVRCAVAFAVNWLAPRLPRYFDRHGTRHMRILSSVWADPFDADAFDIDIQYGTGVFAGATSHRLTRESITPLCTPALAETLRMPADLAHHRLIHVQGYKEGWANWLAAAKVRGSDVTGHDPAFGIQTDTTLMACALASEGLGIALGRTSVADPYRASGALIAPFGLELEIAEGFFVLERPDENMRNDARLFVEWLLEEAGGSGQPPSA